VTSSQLRAIRQELALTQAALAEAIGVRPNTVARWERGVIGISEPTARLVEKIAAERGVAKRGKLNGRSYSKD
jgi:transcriptional regulator with XRE-family HTH domain